MIPDAKLDLYLKRTLLALGWMLLALGAVWAAGRLAPVAGWILDTLSPFLLALVLAYLFNPVVDLVQKRLRLGRVGGILAVALLLVLLAAVFFGLLAPVLYTQSLRVASAVETHLLPLLEQAAGRLRADPRFQDIGGTIQEWVRNSNLDLKSLAGRALSAAPDLTQGGATALKGAAAGIGRFLGGIGGFFASLVLVVLIAFYYLVEFDAIPAFLRRILPDSRADRILEILTRVDAAVGGFLRGQLIVCSLIALIASAGLAAIGMQQYAVLVGVLAGAANVVPYLGPLIGTLPGVLWAFLSPGHATWESRLIHAALVLGLFGLIQSLDGLLFQPRIVGKNSNLHPLLVLLALLAGARFGLVGLVLAVPTACVARVLFLELFWERHLAARDASTASRKESPCPPSRA